MHINGEAIILTEGVVVNVVVPEFVSPSLGIFDAVRAGFF